MNVNVSPSADTAVHPTLHGHVIRVDGLTGVRLPLVSIIITNFNYINYVHQAINSVAVQTYKNFECVIVDDSSTDGSYESIQIYLNKLDDNRFRLLKTPRNIGQFGAIKVGIENTNGPFVCCLDADDILFPEFIKEHIAAHLNEVWSASVSSSDSCQINADGEIIEGTQWFLKKPNVRYDAAHYVMATPVYPLYPDKGSISDQLYYITADYQGYHGATGSCLMFRRSFLELAAPTTEEKVCADYYYYVLAHSFSGSLIIPKPLTYYRVHGSNNFNRGVVLGSVNAHPVALEEINSRLHRLMLDKLLECEVDFSVYPRDRYYALVRYLTPSRGAQWGYGRRSAIVRQAYGLSKRWVFALNHHPLLRKLPIRKILNKKPFKKIFNKK